MSKDKIKNAASRVGNGLLTGVTVLHNSSLATQIAPIDTEIKELEVKLAELRQKRQALVDQRIEKY